VLSYIGSTKQYLDRQRTEITAAKDAILEAIRILQELLQGIKFTENPYTVAA